jgi:putative membrane protein
VNRTALALGLLALAGAPLPAASPLSPGAALAQAGAAALGEPDTTFLADAIRSGLAEAELARIGAEQASSPDVKAFAERMVADHTGANAKLAALAERHGISAEGTKGTPPLRPDDAAAAKAREIAGMSGAALDQAFMRQMIEDHVKAVELFGREAEAGKDEEVRGLAAATLPTLQEHLQAARAVGGRVGVSG